LLVTHKEPAVIDVELNNLVTTVLCDVLIPSLLSETTSSLLAGLVVPIPTLPLLSLAIIVPLVVGNVSVVVPDTAGASSVTEPDVSPLKTNLDTIQPSIVLILL
jgi:hypothetical protein